MLNILYFYNIFFDPTSFMSTFCGWFIFCNGDASTNAYYKQGIDPGTVVFEDYDHGTFCAYMEFCYVELCHAERCESNLGLFIR